jgi:hypothetical protein
MVSGYGSGTNKKEPHTGGQRKMENRKVALSGARQEGEIMMSLTIRSFFYV